MVPAIFGSSVAQINVLLGGMIASLLPVGSISYLYFSDRLMEFPLGLFSIALATVTLPTLSRLWASDDKTEFAQTLDWSMRLAMLIVVPAAAAGLSCSPGRWCDAVLRRQFRRELGQHDLTVAAAPTRSGWSAFRS